jgi:hypothetical protein
VNPAIRVVTDVTDVTVRRAQMVKQVVMDAKVNAVQRERPAKMEDPDVPAQLECPALMEIRARVDVKARVVNVAQLAQLAQQVLRAPLAQQETLALPAL